MKSKFTLTRSLLLSSLLLASASVAGAAVTQYAGTFTATFPTTVPVGSWESYQGIPALAGSWSLQFDDSILVGDQFFQSFPVQLDSLSLTPGTINLTEFTTANVSAELVFINGALSQLMLGGGPMAPSGAGGGFDSFSVAYSGQSHELQVVSIGSATTNGYQTGNPATGSFNPTAVPEPSSSLLAVTAVAGLLLRRSRRA